MSHRLNCMLAATEPSEICRSSPKVQVDCSTWLEHSEQRARLLTFSPSCATPDYDQMSEVEKAQSIINASLEKLTSTAIIVRTYDRSNIRQLYDDWLDSATIQCERLASVVDDARCERDQRLGDDVRSFVGVSQGRLSSLSDHPTGAHAAYRLLASDVQGRLIGWQSDYGTRAPVKVDGMDAGELVNDICTMTLASVSVGAGRGDQTGQ